MLFTNLTPARTARLVGRFVTLALAVLFAAAPAQSQSPAQSQTPAQNQTPASNPAPGTAPMQPSSSSADGQSSVQAAPGAAPIATHRAAAALAPGHGPSYHNRWDLYGGLSFMNGQAGQNLPKRYNMGGGEGQATFWLTPHLGVAGDYRWAAGTTPVFANQIYNRPLIIQNIFAGGVQYRGPKNRYVAINYHAFAGGDDGNFSHSVDTYPNGVSPYGACTTAPGQKGNIGVYCNHIAPWAAIGGSLDFNQGPRFAVRLSPDLDIEHFGTETRYFFGISLGILFRGGRH